MMQAAKHGDPQLGIDIHLCVTPATVPLPTPHLSIVFDPFDYLPIFGATVTVNGMKRATAGTGGIVVHIPPGFPFAPKMPDKEDELFMGSSTVDADGDPMSHIVHPVLGCQIAGMMSPPRLRKKKKNMMLLPTTFNLAIPTNVFIGGPPTISLMALAKKLGFAALGKFAKSRLFKKIRRRIFRKLKPGFLKCVILRAEPVNILTGEVSVEQSDFTLPGRIPIEWERTYSSGTKRRGCCGYGWETPVDMRLEVDPADGSVTMIHPTIGPLFFDRLPQGPGETSAELELMDGALLSERDGEFHVRTKEDRIYRFAKYLANVTEDGGMEYPITHIYDLCGNWLEFERSGGRVAGIRESAGRRIVFSLDGDMISEVVLCLPDTEERHVFVRYEYDLTGDLVTVRDALDNPYTFAYDDHRMMRHTDRNGLSFYYEYEKPDAGDWRVAHAWGDGGLYDYRFEYLDVLNERRITDSLGHVSIVKLDERGLPISEIDPLDGITSYEYDDSCRTTAVTDPGHRRTEYEYDQRGNLIKLTRPDDTCVQTEFDAASKAVLIVEPNGARWQQKWDERGLLVEQTTPLGNVSHYEYDSRGQLVAFINPRNARTGLAFDEFGNLIGLKDALGHRTRLSFDHLGNVTSKIDPLDQQTRYAYDLKGRLIQVVMPSGVAINCGYDAEDNLVNYVDENGHETRLEYSGLGEIAKKIQPDGYTVQYHHDTEERLIGVTNQRGETYHLKRDALGRVVEEVDYWGQARRYTYDASGDINSSCDPLERTIIYATDPLGRILKKILPDGFEESFAYDASGNLVETANSHGSVKREFDLEGKLIKETQGTFSIQNTYDANGNRVTRETSLGNIVSYEFDALDQAVSVRINQDEPIRIERDAVGRIDRELLSPHLSRSFSYSADGYLTEQSVSGNGTQIFSTGFEYDPAGNLTKRNDSQYGTDVYRYDPLGRIVSHLDPQGRISRYLNDSADDRLRTRIVDDSGRCDASENVAQVGWNREGEYRGTCYRFDRTGNLVERRDDQRDLLLLWDANQRLIESQADGAVTRYGYDPLGRRLFKETEGRCTQFFWDGDALVGETIDIVNQPEVARQETEKNKDIAGQRKKNGDAAPKKKKEYVYYPESFEPLALVSASGEGRHIYHYHNEPNGCPTRLTDDNGQVAWAARYDVWGKIDGLPVNIVDQPIRLQGQYADIETGLTYNRNRYYISEIGAYASRDPLGIEPSPNTYTFGLNTYSWIDPLGLNPIKPYDIVTYGTKESGLEMHHGVLDVWASNNIPGYVSRASHNPAIALLSDDHAETKRIYRDWLEKRTGKRVGGRIDWNKISKREIHKLSERMFDAAKVPKHARKQYYSSFWKYVKKGCGK